MSTLNREATAQEHSLKTTHSNAFDIFLQAILEYVKFVELLSRRILWMLPLSRETIARPVPTPDVAMKILRGQKFFMYYGSVQGPGLTTHRC